MYLAAKKGVGPAKKPVNPAANFEAAKEAAPPPPPAEAPPAEAPPAEAPPPEAPAQSPVPEQTSEEASKGKVA